MRKIDWTVTDAVAKQVIKPGFKIKSVYMVNGSASVLTVNDSNGQLIATMQTGEAISMNLDTFYLQLSFASIGSPVRQSRFVLGEGEVAESIVYNPIPS